MGDFDLQSVTERLNARFGPPSEQRRERPKPPPITDAERRALVEYRAEMNALAVERQRAEERLWQEYSRPLYARSPACLEAKYRAAKEKPMECQRCGRGGTLHAHHVIPYATLKRLGLHEDVEAHIFEWLCEACHIKEHEHEPVVRLMRKRSVK